MKILGSVLAGIAIGIGCRAVGLDLVPTLAIAGPATALLSIMTSRKQDHD